MLDFNEKAGFSQCGKKVEMYIVQRSYKDTKGDLFHIQISILQSDRLSHNVAKLIKTALFYNSSQVFPLDIETLL